MLLEASKDGKALQTIDLAKRDCFILGRQPELCHVTLEHASVSRQHVAILHGQPPGQAQGWFLIDLGSAHGTGASSAKGQPYARVKSDAPPFALVPGASFRIGKSSRVYTVKEDARRSRGSSSRPAPTVPERPRDDDDDSDDDDDDDMMHPDDRAAAARRRRRRSASATMKPSATASKAGRARRPPPEPAPGAAVLRRRPPQSRSRRRRPPAPKWTTAEVNKMTVAHPGTARPSSASPPRWAPSRRSPRHHRRRRGGGGDRQHDVAGRLARRPPEGAHLRPPRRRRSASRARRRSPFDEEAQPLMREPPSVGRIASPLAAAGPRLGHAPGPTVSAAKSL